MGIAYNTSMVINGIQSYIDVMNPTCYPGFGVTCYSLITGRGGAGSSASSISATNGISFGTNKNVNLYIYAVVTPTEYTKICWFNLDDVTTFQPLICGWYFQRHCMWMNKTDKLTASHSNTDQFSTPVYSSIAGTTSLSTGVWYFGAVTYSSTSGFNIYLNGRRDQTSATTQTFQQSNDSIFVGYNAEFFTTPAVPTLNGKVGMAIVYNRVLSAAEILQNYNATKKRYGL